MKQIEERNIIDTRFLPLLGEAIEKNKIMRNINYKDHISKVLETRMNMHWKRLIMNN
jgi:hypothetical protein